MDLWRPGQRYRVASYIGLAAVLILVSFSYQWFMTGKDEEVEGRGRRLHSDNAIKET